MRPTLNSSLHISGRSGGGDATADGLVCFFFGLSFFRGALLGWMGSAPGGKLSLDSRSEMRSSRSSMAVVGAPIMLDVQSAAVRGG